MFDSREIARRALVRADEIKLRKKSFHLKLGTSSILVAICVMAIVIAVPMISRLEGDAEDAVDAVDLIEIDENETPLAVLLMPDENALPCTDTGHSVEIPYISEVFLEADSDEVKINLANPIDNLYLFVFEIELADTGERLFSSGLVEPGMCIESITISKTFAEGEYPAKLTIRTYDKDDIFARGSISIGFDLICK